MQQISLQYFLWFGIQILQPFELKSTFSYVNKYLNCDCDADDELFGKAMRLSNHVLHTLIPSQTSASQRLALIVAERYRYGMIIVRG